MFHMPKEVDQFLPIIIWLLNSVELFKGSL